MPLLTKILHNIHQCAGWRLLLAVFFLVVSFYLATARLHGQNVLSASPAARPYSSDTKSIFQSLANNVSYKYGTHFARNNKRFQKYSYVKKTLKDTTKNRIKELREREDNEGYMLFLEIEDCNSQIKIVVYNMLGKKVLDVYDGYPNNEPDYYYDIPTGELPDGIYLCVVQGKGFQLPEKFIVSR